MRTYSKLLRLAILASSLGVGSLSFADTITAMTVAPDGTVSYNGAQRDAWLKSGVQGYAVGDVTGTPQAANVGALFGNTWQKEGELTAVGTNDLLTVTLTSGTWGNGPLYGTWAIDPSFWSTYGRAVITMHVGNGAGNPDWFLWEITANATSGTFYYKREAGGGGGLSNIFLWGGSAPNRVPDSGTSAILLGSGLIALGLLRRKLT